MANKPTKAYLALKEALVLYEQEENNKAKEAILQAAKNEKDNIDRQARINKPQEMKRQKEKIREQYNLFYDNVKSNILESCLSTIIKKSLPEVISEEHNNFIHNITRDFIQEEGLYPLLDRMHTKTQFLFELADEVEKTTDEEMEDIDAEEPDTMMINKEHEKDLICKIEGNEEVEDISNIIKSKVSRATEEFMEKNIVDQTDIKDTLLDTKEKLASVRTGDDALDEEIRQEASLLAKRKIAKIHNRPHGVFEQLVINMTNAIISNESIKESYVSEEKGRLDMDAIIEKCTCMYTLMEMANTLRLKEFNENNINNYISFN